MEGRGRSVETGLPAGIEHLDKLSGGPEIFDADAVLVPVPDPPALALVHLAKRAAGLEQHVLKVGLVAGADEEVAPDGHAVVRFASGEGEAQKPSMRR